MRRVLATLAIALDFIAPRTADRLATWLWHHAIEQALAYQRGDAQADAPAHRHPTPDQTPPVPATTPDAPHSTPRPGTTTWAERDADSSQQNR